MFKKIAGIMLAIIVAVLFCAGCGKEDNATKPVSTPALVDAPAAGGTVKDSAGRMIKIPATMKRVIALNVSTFNMITAIGAADTVLGVNDNAQESVPAAASKEVFATAFDPMVEKALGEGYTDRTAAKAAYDKLISRTGWHDLAAVKNNKVLLLAQNIGTTPEGSIIGMLYMAKTMYPDKFADIDPYTVYKEMEQEFFDVEATGIIAYP
ncbi:hypothetical protein SCACP_06220 [Sporomusa carbonis]|uniref:hypothetical protein n=1 Tax=Sporomusa carbonis TaxID=3076075 RepID=UPI003A7153D5